MDEVFLWVAGVFTVVAVIIGGILYFNSVEQAKSREICADHGMSITDLSQGTGKGRHSVYLCRAQNGQLYSF